MAIFSVGVADALDNGYEIVTVSFDTTESLYVAKISGVPDTIWHSGMRFIDVTVPQGSTINSATITTYGNAVIGTPNARWYAWANDNAGRFSFGGNLPSNVTKTTAFTTFSNSTGTVVHDITSVIQEIINRAGRASGNAINMIAFDNGTPTDEGASWDGVSVGTPAAIEIDYTASGGSVNSNFFMLFK